MHKLIHINEQSPLNVKDNGKYYFASIYTKSINERLFHNNNSILIY